MSTDAFCTMNTYREPSPRYVPCCSHCMTNRWLGYDGMWAVWICGVCGEWVEPYEDDTD